MINKMSEECYQNVQGSTDSEHIFHLFLTFLPNYTEVLPIETVINAVDLTIECILELCIDGGIKEPCSLNLVITDGINVIATRYRNGRQVPPSLYFKYGSHFKCVDGRLDCDSCDQASEVVISSAPLSQNEESDDPLIIPQDSEYYSRNSNSNNSNNNNNAHYYLKGL